MNLRRTLSVVVVIVMVFSLAACGGSKDGGSQESASISSAEQQEVINQLAEEAAAVPEPDTQAAMGATASQDSSTVQDSAAAVTDKLIGEWADINDASRVVKITSNGSEYQYVDPDGTYAGTLKDGVLTIQISDAENDTAEVFIDSKTGNLVTNYQGDIYEFTRKLLQ